MNRQGITLAAALVAATLTYTSALADETTPTRDELHAKVQKICPVTSNQLGSHGKPVKVKIGKQEIFVCCKACLKGKVNAKHWGEIHANFVKAQAKCPVMDKPLPENPKWTVVKGKIVYICCPPCTKKITAEPDKYLKQVDKLYNASLSKEDEPQ